MPRVTVPSYRMGLAACQLCVLPVVIVYLNIPSPRPRIGSDVRVARWPRESLS